MKIKITKISDVGEFKTKQTIDTGWSHTFSLKPKDFDFPTVGQSFVLGRFATSNVVEILTDECFQTMNSVYSWQIVEA